MKGKPVELLYCDGGFEDGLETLREIPSMLEEPGRRGWLCVSFQVIWICDNRKRP